MSLLLTTGTRYSVLAGQSFVPGGDDGGGVGGGDDGGGGGADTGFVFPSFIIIGNLCVFFFFF